ncbi:IPTL-CTERM sorting domain-containing protein [Acidovorax sp. BL-A-41-H1]|uniref:IPTL-CTERM sorting domain-containing protein n=1 Tax=Acidovorax sp. BL-A-41-H1 TaxID=3421102 RepID=UPI003F79448F
MKTIFKHWLVGAALLLTACWAHAQSTVYTATSGVYTMKTDFTVCGVGPCQNFTLAMSASGSFTTASPLANNLVGANVAASVTSFTFSDGINTYSSTNPAVRAYRFQVSTNASGAITSADVFVELWQSGTSPHAFGDRFALVRLTGTALAYNNDQCIVVGVSPAGAADSCSGDNADAGRSTASGGAVVWTRAVSGTTPQAIPTLSEWGLIISSALVGLAGFAALRRKSI